MARTRRGTVIEPGAPPQPTDDGELLDDDSGEPDDLEFLLDASTPDVTWFIERYKSQDEVNANPRGKPLVFVAKLPAPIDLNAFHREYGGGAYRFARQLGNGQFAGARKVELDGPPRVRVFDPPRQAPAVNGGAPPAPMTPVATLDPNARVMRALIREVRQLREEAKAARSAPVPIMGGGGLDMIGQIFNLAEKIANRQSSVPDTLTPVIEAFTKGLDLGTTREPMPAAAGTDWAALAREVAPVVKELLGGLAQAARARRGPMPSPGPAAAAASPTSSAAGPVANPTASAVVENVPAAAAPADDDMNAVRWRGLVDSLARAIGRGADPIAWTDSLPDMLLESDLAQLRLAGPERIIAELQPQAALYPILGTPAAEVFIRRVHAELVSPSEPDDESE